MPLLPLRQFPDVEPIPYEACRYYAQSVGESGRYIVDLLGYGGRGECGCDDFVIRCRINQRKSPDEFVDYLNFETGEPDPNRTICKHIAAARRLHTNASLKHLSMMQEALVGDGHAPNPRILTGRCEGNKVGVVV
jgi:hypothetical protein